MHWIFLKGVLNEQPGVLFRTDFHNWRITIDYETLKIHVFVASISSLWSRMWPTKYTYEGVYTNMSNTIVIACRDGNPYTSAAPDFWCSLCCSAFTFLCWCSLPFYVIALLVYFRLLRFNVTFVSIASAHFVDVNNIAFFTNCMATYIFIDMIERKHNDTNITLIFKLHAVMSNIFDISVQSWFLVVF